MPQNFEQLFSNLSQPEPRPRLFERVWNRLQKEKQLLIVKRKLFLISILSVITGVGLAPVSKSVYINFAESGFFKFFSLIFSDFNAVMASWKNYLISLLETLPVMNLILLLAVFLIFLEALKFLAKNIKIISQTKFSGSPSL
ncbi:hypothetical protein COU23_00350 [Candidatus Kuenenbacteria bacterium CG10_big_fil_rev_8_21_14_0_10_36_11]|uniref:Uncharacterized protein n=1 Tax=Candidatus Kuenenbacteria bacterium CG10_big_fil_rev_8_21_14_0_10_36_11 TaxID=1974618 RepID=A0A2M6WBG3_9BACT|nr:MAG: hypothetical protein COU23_00350 [Candidatus Kuenenbacteria bacterium CG10_big_fil_rev_8_21_14_0_10_36_11]